MFMGLFLILVASYVSIYVVQMDSIKKILPELPGFLSYEFIVVSVVFILAYFIYLMLEKIKMNKFYEDIENINNVLSNFVSEKTFKEVELNTHQFNSTYTLVKNLIKEYEKLQTNLGTKIKKLEDTNEQLSELLNLENVSVCKINVNGKLIKANQKFLKFVNFENESKFNLKVKSLKDIIDTELEKEWIDYDNQTIKIKMKDIDYLLYVNKINKKLEYVLTFIDISKFEEEKKELERKTLYFNKYLKSEKAMNKLQKTTMIRILNYENYAAHLGKSIMELFEDEFIEKVKNLGYEEIFKIQNNTFAVYDFKVNFEKYKKVLEESIKILVAGDEYIFNPKVVLASGLNYEQAYQQVIESGYTLISKQKDDYKYPLDTIKQINKAILNNTILLGYKLIQNKDNIMFIYPSVKDDITLRLIEEDMVVNIAREFNLYLVMIKQLIISNLHIIKNYKIIIDVASADLLSTTMLTDLLLLIKREELSVVFNVDINSKYNLVLPILKQIRSVAQLSIKNVGKGYISFKDLYVLKVEYLEIDNSIVDLMKQNPQWKFLLDSVKLLISGQNTKLLAYNYSDDKVLKIENELKIYEID